MIVTANAVKQPPSLTRVVQIAGPNSDGRHCSRSPESIHDPLEGSNGQGEEIVGIAKLIKNRQVVGFIYRTASGRYYAQALASMPHADQEKASIIVEKKGAGHKEHGFAYSSIKEIKHIPPRSDISIYRADNRIRTKGPATVPFLLAEFVERLAFERKRYGRCGNEQRTPRPGFRWADQSYLGRAVAIPTTLPANFLKTLISLRVSLLSQAIGNA